MANYKNEINNQGKFCFTSHVTMSLIALCKNFLIINITIDLVGKVLPNIHITQLWEDQPTCCPAS